MDRYMLHLTNTNYLPKDSRSILYETRNLTTGMVIVIRDVRVSTKYVEIDVSLTKETLDEVVEKLKPIGELDHARHVFDENIKKEDAIKQGIFYFNNERFWECHEAFEGVWLKCTGSEKTLLQGIILVAVSFVHYQKDQDNICISVLKRASGKLENITGMYHDIDIDKLKKTIEAIQESRKISMFTI